MKYILLTGVLAVTTAQAATFGNGQTTNNIKLQGLPGTYTYKRAGNIDVSSGTATCNLVDVKASGPLAPLTNEMHHIFRGPLDLKQFAVYSPKAGSVKRDTIRESVMERRGRLAHLDKHKKRHVHRHAKRNLGEMVTATINGEVVSFVDDWSSKPTPDAGPVAAPAPETTPEATTPNVAMQQDVPAGARINTSPKVDVSSTSDLSSSEWTRVAYFDKQSKTADNIMFTANNNFVTGLGFTQGYCASNGVDSANGPQILNGVIPDNYEVIISAGTACSDSDKTGGCAVYAPGSKAHHGFGGDRVVIMEYTMPESVSSTANKFTGNAQNTNLPAIWALGSDTVNIAQYGLGPQGTCSGWTSGAGEFDIHEVLPGGVDTNIGYASFHMGDVYSGTPPEGFVRPSDANKSQKLAYVLSGNYAGIHVLGSDFDLDGELTAEDVQSIISGQTVASAAGSNKIKTSFKLAKAGAPAYPVSVDVAPAFNAILHS